MQTNSPLFIVERVQIRDATFLVIIAGNMRFFRAGGSVLISYPGLSATQAGPGTMWRNRRLNKIQINLEQHDLQC